MRLLCGAVGGAIGYVYLYIYILTEKYYTYTIYVYVCVMCVHTCCSQYTCTFLLLFGWRCTAQSLRVFECVYGVCVQLYARSRVALQRSRRRTVWFLCICCGIAN